MEDGAERSRLIVGLGVRPPRTVVLVPRIKPWSHLVLMEAALAAQSGVWGGHGNLVVPWTPDLLDRPVFWEIVDRYDPDQFVVYVPTWEEVADVDAGLHRQFMERHRRRWTREHGEETAASLVGDLERWPLYTQRLFKPDWPEPLLRRLAPLHDYGGESLSIHTISATSAAVWPAMSVTELNTLPPLLVNRRGSGTIGRLLLTASLGRLPNPIARMLKERDMDLSEPGQPLRGLEWTRAVVEGTRSGARHPWSLAEQGLAQYWSGRSFIDPPIATIVAGDTAWDFALYYALKRMTGRAWWLPSWLRRANSTYTWGLRRALGRATGRTVGEVAVVSVSASATLDAVSDVLLKAADTELPVARIASVKDVLPENPIRIYERDHIGRGVSLELIDGRTPPLDTPIPSHVHTSPESDMRWITELQSPEWAPIRHPRLATELVERTAYGADQVRATRAGVAYTCPNTLVLAGQPLASAVARPELVPLTLFQQLERIAEAGGWRVATSDKGAYATESARLLGGATELAVALRDPVLRRIFDTYIKRHDAPGKWLSHDTRRYLSWMNLEELVGSQATRERVPGLLERRILERGLLLKCERCRQHAWYHLERVDDAFRCNRCRLSQMVERHWVDTVEPVWFYRLAEVLYQLLSSNGDVPLLAVEDAFEGVTPLARTYELDVYAPKATKGLELDIFVSERSRLWIGEANVTGDFDADRLRELLGVARAFEAHGVILATTKASFPRATRAAADVVFRGLAHPELRLLPGVRREVDASGG